MKRLSGYFRKRLSAESKESPRDVNGKNPANNIVTEVQVKKDDSNKKVDNTIPSSSSDHVINTTTKNDTSPQPTTHSEPTTTTTNNNNTTTGSSSPPTALSSSSMPPLPIPPSSSSTTNNNNPPSPTTTSPPPPPSTTTNTTNKETFSTTTSSSSPDHPTDIKAPPKNPSGRPGLGVRQASNLGAGIKKLAGNLPWMNKEKEKSGDQALPPFLRSMAKGESGTSTNSNVPLTPTSAASAFANMPTTTSTTTSTPTTTTTVTTSTKPKTLTSTTTTTTSSTNKKGVQFDSSTTIVEKKSPAATANNIPAAKEDKDSSLFGRPSNGGRTSKSGRASKGNASERDGNSTGTAKTGRERTKSQGKYLSTAVSSMFQLTEAEQAFMPGDLLKRLGESAGQLPPAPSVFAGSGAVLFVDVSGFTALAEELNTKLVPVKAAAALAKTITKVLHVLTICCLDGGGEVGKFAGDALLCVWESKNLDLAEAMAKKCAVEMLIAMDKLNKMEGTSLGIHGGVAKGSLVHFHLGSASDDLRWYLMAGEAVAAATTLVDVASRGEFAVLEGIAKGLPEISDALTEKETPANMDRQGSFKRFDQSSRHIRDKDAPLLAATGMGGNSLPLPGTPARPKTLVRGKTKLNVSLLYPTSQIPAPKGTIESAEVAAVLKDGLPRECNVYIPLSLRNQLDARDKKGGEMRRRVAIIFVELGDLCMTEDELVRQSIDDRKLDALNNAFVTMTRITHAFQGECRDMLFDDKGCIYIAIFGAHPEEEREDNRWNLYAVKAAMAISAEIPEARLGVSCGMCFTGLAGESRRRQDFVVVGHEVNMAARYMSNALPGQILVSSGVAGTSKDMIKYTEEFDIVVGKGQWAKPRTVYVPDKEIAHRSSFLAQYKNALKDAALFVGRANELMLIEDTLKKISNGRSGIIVIEAPAGRGKSSLVSRAKKMGRGKIKVATGYALATEKTTAYYVFRQILEAYTGIRPAMTPQESRAVIERIEGGKGDRVNVAALAQVLPWIGDNARPGDAVIAAGGGIGPEQVAESILKVIRLTMDKSHESSSLIVIEDVQWMDSMSLELLTRLLDGTDKLQRLAFLLTFRKSSDSGGGMDKDELMFSAIEESMSTKVVEGAMKEPETLEKTPQLQSTKTLGGDAREALRQELVENVRGKLRKFKFNSAWIDLQPFDRRDADTLATQLIGAQPNEPSSVKLWDAAKGDPFHIQLLIEWIQKKQGVRMEKSGAATITLEKESFPPTVEALILSRVQELSAGDRLTLEIASSGGEMFDAAYVSAISKLLSSQDSKWIQPVTVDAALKSLHAAMDLDILVYFPDNTRDESQHKWKFKHDLFYRTVWIHVDAGRRGIMDKTLSGERRKLNMRLKANILV
jgi:class 3 adenylate cyclase